jgi:site-specific DNA-methyltransferase (adenine-specific)
MTTPSHARLVMTSATDSLEKEEWSTPRSLFERLSAIHGCYQMDLAASGANTMCRRFISRDQDALAQVWSPECRNAARFWLNPPYGRHIDRWIKKARASAIAHPVLISCLIPARVETAYWTESIWTTAGQLRGAYYGLDDLGVRISLDSATLGIEIRLLSGRVSFELAGKKLDPAPFPSAVVTFSHPK